MYVPVHNYDMPLMGLDKHHVDRQIKFEQSSMSDIADMKCMHTVHNDVPNLFVWAVLSGVLSF